MDFNILLILCLVLGVAALAVTIFLTVKTKKKCDARAQKGVVKPVYVFIAGFFVSAACLFFPLYFGSVFNGEPLVSNILKSIVLSLHNTIRLFVVDDDISFVQSVLGAGENVKEWVRMTYSVVMIIYYVVAPVLTATFILSLVSDFNESVRYFLLRNRNVYVFSVLSEESLALARDAVNAKENGKKALVLFADVDDLDDEDEGEELKMRAKKLGAILFKGDVTSVRLYKGRYSLRKIYLISNDEEVNVIQALDFIETVRKNKSLNNARTQIFTFARSEESEILLNAADKGKIKVRRVNRGRNMVWDILRTHSVFDDAYESEDMKIINVCVAGYGGFGAEFVKALCWVGQMPGYRLDIHVFDEGEDAEDRLKGECPEIAKYNGVYMEGCPYYKITFHNGVDVTSGKFEDALVSAGRVTTFIATLGSDEANMQCAINARRILGRLAAENGWSVPPILAVVYNDVLNDTVTRYGLSSVSGKEYGITPIGALKKRFSLEVVEQKPLEKLAYRAHRAWSKTRENLDKFRKYEYFRRSSLSEALHADFTKKEAAKLGVAVDDFVFGDCEHKRWMAYMRTEGYVYGEKKDDVAKTHPSLVATKLLSEEEFEKDFIVIRSRQAK